MLNDIEINMMLKFLERNYPVKRIKINARFKRCIVLDDGSPFLLSDYTNIVSLKYKLMEILYFIFSSDEETNKFVITKYLKK